MIDCKECNNNYGDNSKHIESFHKLKYEHIGHTNGYGHGYKCYAIINGNTIIKDIVVSGRELKINGKHLLPSLLMYKLNKDYINV